MANPKPDSFVIRVNARKVDSPASRKTIAGTLSFDVSRRADRGRGQAQAVDPHALVVRPGDTITFELGDVPFGAAAPELRVTWKFPSGKRWEAAPTRPGQEVEIPAGQGFAGARFSFNAEIDLNEDVRLPSQSRSNRGTTLIHLDPDIIVDEC